MFHQLFEGLSLGIRIASLPPKDIESDITIEGEESLFSTPPLASLTPKNLDSDPGVLPRHGHISNNPNSQINGRMDVHPRISYLRTFRERQVPWLEPTLSFLFSVTTPFGMCVGMILWKERDGSDTSLVLSFLSLYCASFTG